MPKTLVAYFSASGVTAKLAKTLAKVTNADLFEIKPVTPYTAKDLDWMDKKSRSTIEMQDKASRPKMAEKLSSCAQYDTVFVGFPIWWYEAPRLKRQNRRPLRNLRRKLHGKDRTDPRPQLPGRKGA